MTVLDCESYDSALACICSVYNISPDLLVDFLIKTDLEMEYEKASSNRDILTRLLESQFGDPTNRFESIAWFHLTRVPKGTTFYDGILPLNLALPRIWQTLVSSVSDQKRVKLEKLRSEGVPNFLYNFKTGHKTLDGPYAMLVRESAFHAEKMGNHDYLRLPEIVEDICTGYNAQYGQSICDEVSAALKKCIVKFVVSDETADTYKEPTLKYCWCKANEQLLDMYANSCYDAKGETIPHEAIRGIQFL
jgi:hypothetical protein